MVLADVKECKRCAALDRRKRFAYVVAMNDKPKFTPGPWVVDEDGDIRQARIDGAVGPTYMRGYRIAITASGTAGDYSNGADARLIAAAPKMYEAHAANEQDADAAAQCLPSLTGILGAIERGHANEIQDALTGVQEAIDAIRARSRAALAMVEGK